MDIKYFIQSGGKTRGPCSLAEMQQHVKRGRLSRFHKVSIDNAKTWAPASNFPELFPPPPRMHLPPKAGANPASPTSAVTAVGPLDREPSVFGLVNDPQPLQPQAQIQPQYDAKAASAPEVEMSWYYSYQGEPQGPVSLQDLQRMIQSGQVTTTTVVWTDGLEDWVEAGRVEMLFSVNGSIAGRSVMGGALPSAGDAQASQLAIASAVLGLLGGCLPVVGSLLAVVLGHMALNRLRRSGEKKGRGLAIAGLVLGYLLLTVLLLGGIGFLVYLLGGTQRR